MIAFLAIGAIIFLCAFCFERYVKAMKDDPPKD